LYKENISGFQLAQILADHCRSCDIEMLEYHPVEFVEAVSHEVDGKNFLLQDVRNVQVLK